MRFLFLIVLIVTCTVLFPRVSLGDKEAIFAVVVGNNRSPDKGLPRLRYADDDAAKFHELLVAIGGHSTVLTVLDARSQPRFHKVRKSALAPTRRALRGALRRTFSAIHQARAAGRRTVFYFIFSGHGKVGPTGQGELHLLDGPFTRTDLFRHVIAASPAAVNHLIIDACHAYFLVNAKGWRQDKSKVDFSASLKTFLRNERLEKYPNTGVLLATARAAETHEWARIESGLFSHQVRSGMTGAADASNDGEVSYSELAAYVSAANSRVRDARARLSVFARPPSQNIDEPLIRIGRHPLRRVRLSRPLRGHFYIEDQRGARYADFHKSDEGELSVALVAGPDYFLRNAEKELRLSSREAERAVRLADMEPRSMAPRGAIDDALRRGLFQVPFGPSFHAGFKTSWIRGLARPLPALEEGVSVERWHVELGYQLTQPVLDRGGLAHGVELGGSFGVKPWLDLGIAAQLSTASAGDWRQRRVAVLAVAATSHRPLGWLRLRAAIGVGYLALLESAPDRRRGDLLALTLMAEAGPELRLHRHLWATVRGGLQLDIFDSDGEHQLSSTPRMLAGLRTCF